MRDLNKCWYKSSRKTAWSKSFKFLEPRTRLISELNILTEDQFDEHGGYVTAIFVTEGLESRCEQKCKKSRDPEVFTDDNACKVDTQSETEMDFEQH